MPLVAGLSPRRSDFQPTPIHVGFVAYKVELEWVVLRGLDSLLSASLLQRYLLFHPSINDGI
jgi:hypothetical protein